MEHSDRRLRRFRRQVRLDVPAEAARAWHARPGAFERLTPAWERVRVLERTGGIEEGDEVRLGLGAGPFQVTWRARHRAPPPGQIGFDDVQVQGPFPVWEHRHRMQSAPGGSWLVDEIDFVAPGGPVSGAVAPLIERKLDRLFAYRHAVTAGDLAAHAGCQEAPASVLVTGASGLVGSALLPYLRTGGHEAVPLVRGAAGTERSWDPTGGRLEPGAVAGVDAVVHLAGANIAGRRWSGDYKRLLWDSRVAATGLLARRLAGSARPPRVLVCASAVGFYGEQGEARVSETSPRGEGFLAELAEAWEDAAAPAREAGIRVVHLRFGVILTRAGGMLARLLVPFLAGVGGRVGDGRQFLSWIALDDALDAIHRAIVDERVEGALNAVAFEPVTNAAFARTLAHVLGRPALVPLPGVAARAALGEMADALLLASTRAVPERLMGLGHRFRFATLEPALRHALGRPGPIRPS